MSRRLVLNPDAEQDLDTIFDYIAQNHPPAAARYIRELQEQCVYYAEFPSRGLGDDKGDGGCITSLLTKRLPQTVGRSSTSLRRGVESI
jgi:plasmid stabilization system protein ParE